MGREYKIMLNTTKRLYTAAEVAAAADLDLETVLDWRRRGFVHPSSYVIFVPGDQLDAASRQARTAVDAPLPAENEPFSLDEALRITAVRALVGHFLPVQRAAEIIDQVPRCSDDEWSRILEHCINGWPHYYVTVRQETDAPACYQVYLSGPPDMDVGVFMKALAAKTDKFGYPLPDFPNYHRVAVFDIGVDITRAIEKLDLRHPRQ